MVAKRSRPDEPDALTETNLKKSSISRHPVDCTLSAIYRSAVRRPEPASTTVAFAADLRSHGGQLAIATPQGLTLTYAELAGRVDEAADRLGGDRRLVAIEMSNDVDSLVHYLATIRGGHVALLTERTTPGDQIGSMIHCYDPDVVVSSFGSSSRVDERRRGTAHELHPDLALLLSTSGSTGSPKLVRLSQENLSTNAQSIADYLDIRPSDRAATSLPFHYCYGLSVVNSNLLRGAGLIVSDLSVVDECFWSSFTRYGGTSFAGVPFTFELLERIDFASKSIPSLRYITQAGGAMPPERVKRFADLAARDGWQLFVMYGQTEATARMAYLPPALASENPSAIGVPIPGGRFEIDIETSEHTADESVGELIYFGPNVMLGYATQPADLALGRSIDRLATGDLARRRPDGLYEIVGRKSRFLKLFGKRVDLGGVESMLAKSGHSVACTGTDEQLIVAVDRATDPGAVAGLVSQSLAIPRSAVRAVAVDEIPRFSSGKADYATIQSLVATQPTPSPSSTPSTRRWFHRRSPTSVRDVYAKVFDRGDISDDATFVTLGGDSLSYVEASIALEHIIGRIPDGWHTMDVRELESLDRSRSWVSHTEANVVLRALAITLVVASHFGALGAPGGASVLLVIAGYNFARFQLRAVVQTDSPSPMLSSLFIILVPTYVVIVLSGASSPPRFLLVQQYAAQTTVDGYWFIDALVQILVVLAIALSFHRVRDLARRRPFRVAVAMLATCIVVRYATAAFDGRDTLLQRTTHMVFWLFALGWVIQLCESTRQRLVISAVAVVTLMGFFEGTWLHEIVLAGVLTLIWVRRLPVPRPFNHAVGLVASASLYIYLTHWFITDPLRLDQPALRVVVALVGGVMIWAVADPAVRRVEAMLHAAFTR